MDQEKQTFIKRIPIELSVSPKKTEWGQQQTDEWFHATHPTSYGPMPPRGYGTVPGTAGAGEPPGIDTSGTPYTTGQVPGGQNE